MNGPAARHGGHARESAREAGRVIRRMSRPRPWQSDYLILREIQAGLAREAARLNGRRGMDVLDVGCKYKPYRTLFEAKASRYVGMDLERYWGVEVMGDASSLPFASDSFDLVLCTQMFYLMREPHRVMEEFLRVTKEGGRIVLTTNGIWPHPPETRLHFWARRELEETLAQFGTVRVHETGGFLQLVPQLANAALAMGVEEYLISKYGRAGQMVSLPLKGFYLGMNLMALGVNRAVLAASRSGWGMARRLADLDSHLALNYLAVVTPRKGDEA